MEYYLYRVFQEPAPTETHLFEFPPPRFFGPFQQIINGPKVITNPFIVNIKGEVASWNFCTATNKPTNC